MIKLRFSSALIAAIALTAISARYTDTASAQGGLGGQPVHVTDSIQQIELVVNTSRVLTFDYKVPELVVENQMVVRATPISPNQILVTALKPGVTAITVSDDNRGNHTIDIHVVGDVRKLESVLERVFPESSIQAVALNTGVILSGTVSRADDIPVVMNTARDFFPEVHNNLEVGDSQLVAIEVKVYEVSRTKLRQLGIDWSILASNFVGISRGAKISQVNAAGGVGRLVFDGDKTNLAFSIFDNSNQLSLFLEALEKKSLAKLLDQPTLVSMSGRPAEFLEGGEIPFEVNQGLGNTTIEFRPFGTKLDVVPFVLGQGRVRLEIRAEVSETSQELSSENGTPGFRVRRVNTGVNMKVGHTLALAGDYKEEIEAETSGIPVLMHLPHVGTFFRRIEERTSEIELVILMTPRFVGEVDPGLMPCIAPGQTTASPSDCEMYLKGYIEVPRCGPDCPGPQCLSPTTLVPFPDAQPPVESRAPGADNTRNLPPLIDSNQTGFGYPEPTSWSHNSAAPVEGYPVSSRRQMPNQ